MKNTNSTPNTMKAQIILSQIVDGQTIYSHSVTLNDSFDGKKLGQIVGALAHRYYQQIIATKMNNGGKGLNLRTPFDIQFLIDGETLVDSVTFDEDIKARIIMGTTKKGQMRFARLLAVSLYHGMKGEFLDSKPMMDLLDEENTFDVECLMADVRTLLDMPFGA